MVIRMRVEIIKVYFSGGNSSTLEFTVTKNVKVYAYGHGYGDGGGSSGQNVIVKNLATNETQEYSTNSSGEKYELMTLSPGNYSMTAKSNYVTFDEWECTQ